MGIDGFRNSGLKNSIYGLEVCKSTNIFIHGNDKFVPG